ncbi:MAG: hypothetical protein KAW45_07840 [Thermoplasmatales archaeon]|nr:hypothetical protein [Thermoplasmatales archaeon]
MKREIIFVIVGVITIIAIILSYLVFNVNFTYDAGEMELISLTETSEGENITVFAEITGASPSSGIYPNIEHESLFGICSASPYSHMEHLGGNNYSVTFQGYNYGGYNGTEIWFVIYYGTNILAERIIQIGHVERSDISTLTITNITQEPKNPTTSTLSVTITADITSNANITEIETNRHIFGKSSRSSGGGSGHIINDTLVFDISLTMGGGYFADSQEVKTYPAGSKVFYQITAEDELGNTALYTDNFTIS